MRYLSGSRVTFTKLFEYDQRVVVPIIQRDYAQGRDSESDVRRDFLDALFGALTLPKDHPSLPLNLDFIYGSVIEVETAEFQPLDGQQRLTTLFLLHWYLAWRDGHSAEFRDLLSQNNGHSRFTYAVRPSSSEFFDGLLKFQPGSHPTELTKCVSWYLMDQSWYFRNWRLDPTIQSSLKMLDEIHRRFKMTDGLYNRLIDNKYPAITFQLLNLENFGLSDDLYIKMNARGKPLTALENFRARYEQKLKSLFGEGETKEIGGENVSYSEYFSRRMDTTWADFFWKKEHRNPQTNLYDSAAINLFRIIVLLSRDPVTDSYTKDIESLQSEDIESTYSSFHVNNWIDKQFSELLILLLDSWSGGKDSPYLLPDTKYFDEATFIKKAMENPTKFTLEEIVQFVGYALYLKTHQSTELDSNEFQSWMRIVFNLSSNFPLRSHNVGRSIERLIELVQHSNSILQHFAFDTVEASGFSERQIKEECLKAQLILAKMEWDTRIYNAETHGYFQGQIEFLFDFCGVLEKWNEDGQSVECWNAIDHKNYSEKFDVYFAKSDVMFGSNGLKDLRNFVWQRALLVFGNYFLPSGSQNESFLTNRKDDQASWKRFLSGSSTRARDNRRYLQELFDRIDVGETIDIREQLISIIDQANDVSPLWRKVLIETPEAFDYCKKHNFRMDSDHEIYLVPNYALNGYHAELFTFNLFPKAQSRFNSNDSLAPLQLNESYTDVRGRELKPGFVIVWSHDDQELNIKIEWRNNKITFVVDHREVEWNYGREFKDRHLATEVKEFLLKNSSFKKNGDELIQAVNFNDFFDELDKLVLILREFSLPSSIDFWQYTKMTSSGELT